MLRLNPRSITLRELAQRPMQALNRISRVCRVLAAHIEIRLPRFFVRTIRRAPGLVVSLTSFPGRINTLWIALESIYRQRVTPEEVVLVLSKDEFPDGKIPASVAAFVNRGLKIIFHDGNIRSYKKLLPLLPEYADKIIVTADDDVIYPKTWLEELVLAHNERPGYVLGHRGAVISTDGSKIAPYASWSRADEETPPSLVFLTGMGGILYPPGVLPEATRDAELAMRLCPTADDIWFKAMTLLNGTPTSKIGKSSGNFPVVRSAQALALHHENVKAGQNDQQLTAVFDYFDLMEALAPPNSRLGGH